MGSVLSLKKESSEENKAESVKLLDKTAFGQEENSQKSENVPNEEGINLELFLIEVYENECKLQIGKDEIGFIQTGIETLVEKIVNKVHENIFEKDLIGVKKCEAKIIKVGSFYEGTRNKFPDEFDFLYVFGECEHIFEPAECVRHFGRCTRDLDCRYILDEVFDRGFEPVCKFIQATGSLQYQTAAAKCCVGNKMQSFHSCKSEIIFVDSMKHGPATLLRFVYHRQSGETRFLDVDLVPAVRVKTLDAFFIENKPKALRYSDIPTGTYLYVGSDISFTEAEVNFMINVLSKNHVKVYRILKYLINGHDDEKELVNVYKKHRTAISRGKCTLDEMEMAYTAYTSYMIKCQIIHHHYNCTERNSPIIGQCVIEVLDMISKDRFSPRNKSRDLIIKIQPRVQEMKDLFFSMQSNCNSVETPKQSISRQIIEDILYYESRA